VFKEKQGTSVAKLEEQGEEGVKVLTPLRLK
jgi:hypothetical protein